jgi:CBS domain containing-hemolysin-like protein
VDFLWMMIALLALSGFFSGSEAALFTLGSRGLDRVPIWVRPLLQDSVASLTIILLGNLVVNLAYFAAATAWARQVDSSEAASIQIAALFLIVVVGEILPKTIAHRYPDGFGRVLLPPILVLMRIFQRPARWLGQHWARKAPPAEFLDSEDVDELIAGEERSVLGVEEHRLLSQILELGSLRAGAIRRPLQRVVKISPQLPLRQAYSQLREENVAWAAVQDEQGNVIGILDLCRQPRGRRVGDVMIPVPILPELAPVAAGVPLLQRSGAPFVLLVDEYGHGTGIIERGRWSDTLLDRLPSPNTGRAGEVIKRLDENLFHIDANLPIHDFKDRFGDPGELDVRTETVSGLLQQRLGRLANLGDHFGWQVGEHCFELKVLEVEGDYPTRLELRSLGPFNASAEEAQ